MAHNNTVLWENALFRDYSKLSGSGQWDHYFEDNEKFGFALKLRGDLFEMLWVGPLLPIVPWIPGMYSYYISADEINEKDVYLDVRIRNKKGQPVTINPSKFKLRLNGKFISPADIMGPGGNIRSRQRHLTCGRIDQSKDTDSPEKPIVLKEPGCVWIRYSTGIASEATVSIFVENGAIIAEGAPVTDLEIKFTRLRESIWQLYP